MNPAFNALLWIFHRLPPRTKGPAREPATNQDIVLLDYRDPATFSALWLDGLKLGEVAIDGQQIDLTDSTKQFLLIGNDPPDRVFNTKIPALAGITFRSHFSATSWLAAWKVRFSPTQKEIDEMDAVQVSTRFAVIDPRQSCHAQGTARALQSVLAAKDCMGRSLVPGAAVLNAPSLVGVCEWLSAAKGEERTLGKDAPHLRDLLKSTIWNELTSNREQHHALSNVFGAFLLRSQVGRGESHQGEPWAQDFLLALVRACGIEVDLGQLRLKNHQGFQRWLTPEEQKAIGSVLLIDDMSAIWEDFLRGATGFAGDIPFGNAGRSHRQSLDCFGSPGFREEIGKLPGRLGAFLESGRRRLRATDLLGSPTKIDEDFVLFLDLRLFGSADGELAEQYYGNLVNLGRLIVAHPSLSRPWLDARAFSDLEEELDGAGGHPRETLLPRLISLLDPTLPIVIFSSTHRTELIDPFRDYGNIIVEFRKPILGGLSDWPAMVREIYGDFHTAMTAAGGILATRKFLAKLEPTETSAA
jgi:hypothetical protein